MAKPKNVPGASNSTPITRVVKLGMPAMLVVTIENPDDGSILVNRAPMVFRSYETGSAGFRATVNPSTINGRIVRWGLQSTIDGTKTDADAPQAAADVKAAKAAKAAKGIAKLESALAKAKAKANVK